MDQSLSDDVMQAAGRAPVRDAVRGVYATLQDVINVRRPICVTSGRCCRFEEFGHRLYVTTMELANFVYEMSVELSVVRRPLSVVGGNSKTIPNSADRATISLPVFTTDNGPLTTDKEQLTTDQPGCPFQADKLCGVHAIRPFGCRVFFCDETSTQWQHDLYERLHADLRRAHDELSVPYHYVEWRYALKALRLESL